MIQFDLTMLFSNLGGNKPPTTIGFWKSSSPNNPCQSYGLRHVQELLPRIFDAYYGYLSTDFSPTEKGAFDVPSCWGHDDFTDNARDEHV